MALKKYKSTINSQRQLVLVDKSSLWSGKPFKKLTKGKKKTGGRNNLGRVTAWHRGGGHKQSYRDIDFKRNKDDVAAEVIRIEYDPNRSSFIALIKYEDGEHSYILAPQKISEGTRIMSGKDIDILPGHSSQLKNIPVGTLVHCIELKPGKGGQLARAAGSFAQLVGKDQGYAQLRLRSGEVRVVALECKATIGVLSNADQQNVKIGKAGRNRWLGKRPVVRGVAMNPIDHPHGGGEGKTSGGRHPVTPWGKPTKGKRTRKNRTTDKYIIRRRYNK